MTVTVFGYLILISIDFYDFISPFSFWFRLRRYIQHSRQCLTTFPPNTSKFVKNTPLCVVFSTLFSLFGNVVKHGLSCLMYNLRNARNAFRAIQFQSIINSRDVYGLVVCWLFLLVSMQYTSTNQNNTVSLPNQEQRYHHS